MAFLRSRPVGASNCTDDQAAPQHDCKACVSADAFYWKRPGMPGRFAQEDGRGDADVAASTHRSCGCVGKARRNAAGPLPLLIKRHKGRRVSFALGVAANMYLQACFLDMRPAVLQ